MRVTAHIILEVEVEDGTHDADHVARTVTGLAQSCAFRAVAEGVRVGDYSVAVVPISRAALAGALELVHDRIREHGQ